MSMDGHGTQCRRNIAENLNRLTIGRTNVTHRQTTDDRQTDGRAIAYSEREREFTFAKNYTLGYIPVAESLGISSTTCTLLKATEVAIIKQKTAITPCKDSRSFNVTHFDTNRKLI